MTTSAYLHDDQCRSYDSDGILLPASAATIYRSKAQHYQRQNGYALLSELFNDAIKRRIFDELNTAFDKTAVRRDFLMTHTSNSPRKMINVRFTDIDAACPTIRKLYHAAGMQHALSLVTGEPTYICPWKYERYIATRLNQAGDTHGWHWDDYAYSLIFILEAPAAQYGGLLEVIPDTEWDKNKPAVEHYLKHRAIISRHHRAGDVYLFRSDKTLHRVTPVQDGMQRTILNMVFASEQDCKTESSKNHQSMEDLFI